MRTRHARTAGVSLGRYAWVFVDFPAEPLDLLLRHDKALLQRLLSTKRRCAGARTDPHAVLRYALKVDQALVLQERNALRQQLVKYVESTGPKHGQSVVPYADAPADPPIRDVIPAELLQCPGAANPIDRCVEPVRERRLSFTNHRLSSLVISAACKGLRHEMTREGYPWVTLLLSPRRHNFRHIPRAGVGHGSQWPLDCVLLPRPTRRRPASTEK